MMPRMDGLETCRRLRARSTVPIIMLTARTDDVDKIVGLELGADDYLTKPFNPRELVARVKAILRRADGSSPRSAAGVVRVGTLSIDKQRREARAGERELALRTKEFDLLAALAESAGIVLTREQHLSQLDGLAAAAAHELGTPLSTIAVVAKELELALERRYEEPSAHPDPAVELPYGQRDADLLARLPPRDHVLVDPVD